MIIQTFGNNMEMLQLAEKEWDVAIILDACRYDSFKKYYKDYLENGELEKEIGGHCTTHWLKNVFEESYPNITYVSGNPWVNSMTPWNGFDPSEKFGKIIDVWEDGWDEDKETIPPEEVTKAGLKTSKNLEEKRLIIHYLQPHYPYLPLNIPKKVKMHFNGINGNENSTLHKFSNFLGERLERIFGRETYWNIREALNRKSAHIEEYLWRNNSEGELKELYEKNLVKVLKEVKTLTDQLEGKIVVTSDHGEAFGENGEFFHPYGTENKAVRDIPYWKKEN